MIKFYKSGIREFVSTWIIVFLTLGLNAQSPCPTITSITATPSSICSGSNSQLTINSPIGYEVSKIDYSPNLPGRFTPSTTVCTDGLIDTSHYDFSLTGDHTLDDDSWSNLPLGFDFDFFGVTYSTFTVGTNGYIFLGSGKSTDAVGDITNTGYGTGFPNTGVSVAPCIAALYSNLNFNVSGVIKFYTMGFAPHRVFVINFSNGQFFNPDSTNFVSGNFSTQIQLFETTNVIEIHTTNSTGDNPAIEGIQNATGTIAYTIPGRNNEVWSVSEDTSDAYRFTPPAYNYTWFSNPHMDSASLSMSNPVAMNIAETTTFYVNVSNDSCTVLDSVTVHVNPIPEINFTGPATPICLGAPPIALTAMPSGGTFSGTGVAGSDFNPSTAGAGAWPVVYTYTDSVTTCTGSVTQEFSVEDCTGINENILAQDVSIYPNPNNGVCTIEIPNANFSEVKISVVDLRGKDVYSATDSNINNGYKKQISLEHLAKGTYFIKLSTDKGIKVKKLSIQ